MECAFCRIEVGEDFDTDDSGQIACYPCAAAERSTQKREARIARLKADVIPFTGRLITHKHIFGCTECGSRSFKFATYGGSLEIVVRCANCEASQTGVHVTIDD